MEEFKIGDVVQLKSGGEKMTVKNVDFPHEDQIQCEWFFKQELKLENFFIILISPFFNTKLLPKNLKMEFNQFNLVS